MTFVHISIFHDVAHNGVVFRLAHAKIPTKLT